MYDKEASHWYGLITKKILKSRLKNNRPEIIFIYNDINSNDDIALANETNGAININFKI